VGGDLCDAGDLAITSHPKNNVPRHIAEKIGRNLHLQVRAALRAGPGKPMALTPSQKGHPLCTIRERIEGYWVDRHAKVAYHPPPPPPVEGKLTFG
jgi:hypothetical protein